MRVIFTFSIWLQAATCAFAQVPVAEQAFIVTKVTISDPEGNTFKPGFARDDTRTVETGLNTRVVTRYLTTKGYQLGEVTNFTTETWYQAGNTRVSVRYGSWRYTNIRHKERQHTISYAEFEADDLIRSLSQPNTLPPGTAVRRSAVGLGNLPAGTIVGSSRRGPNYTGSGMIIADAEQASAKVEFPPFMPLLDTTGVEVKVLLQDVEQEVAGYPCKRAIISLKRNDSVLVQIKAWYNTQVYLPDLPATGNPHDASTNLFNTQMEHFYALAQLPGLAMQYEMPDLFGNTITVEVTKLKTNKKPRKNLFTPPSSINIVPYAERRAAPNGLPW